MSSDVSVTLFDTFGNVVNDAANGDAVECAAVMDSTRFQIRRGKSIVLSEQGKASFPMVLAGMLTENNTLRVTCTYERCLADQTKVVYQTTTLAMVHALNCIPGMSMSSDDEGRGLCSWCKATRSQL